MCFADSCRSQIDFADLSQVSACVGRPYSIPDFMISTQFPSLIDDDFIDYGGFTSQDTSAPSPKRIAEHYYRLRILQSETLHVFQHLTAQAAVAKNNVKNPFMNTNLSSPYQQQFSNFDEWRLDMDRRLQEWKESAPQPQDTRVDFSPWFLDLNYWQAVLMLFRTSLIAPTDAWSEAEAMEGSVSTVTPRLARGGQPEHETTFFKIAEAAQEVIRLYVALQEIDLVNYTYLATHHLFMAGKSCSISSYQTCAYCVAA